MREQALNCRRRPAIKNEPLSTRQNAATRLIGELKTLARKRLIFSGLLLLALIMLTALSFWLATSLFREEALISTKPAPAPVKDPGGVPDEAWQRGERLVVGVDDPFKQINPLFATGDGELYLTSLIFEPLFIIDDEAQPTAVLADTWQFESNKRLLSVTLKQDHTFPDGRVIAASDVAFTYQCLLSPHYNGPFKGHLKALTSVEATDQNTVDFHFERDLDQVPYSLLTIGIMNRQTLSLEPDQVNEIPLLPQIPDGSGCFRLTEWSETSAVLTLRPGYCGDIRTIELRTVASQAKFRLLQDGQLDIVRNIWDDRMQQRAKTLAGYTFIPVTSSPLAFLLLNPENDLTQLWQTDSQRLAILQTMTKQPLSEQQLTDLKSVPAGQVTIYFFKGLDQEGLAENKGQAQSIADRLAEFGLKINLSAVDWPELAERATRNQFDLLLFPALTNNRLPEQTILLDDSFALAATAVAACYQQEVFIVSNRLSQVTINPQRNILASTRGSFTDRIQNIRLVENRSAGR